MFVTLYKLQSSIAFKVIFLEGLCGNKRKCANFKKKKKIPTFVSFLSQWLSETKLLLPLFSELLKPVRYLRHICSVTGFSKQMKMRRTCLSKKAIQGHACHHLYTPNHSLSHMQTIVCCLFCSTATHGTKGWKEQEGTS